MNCSPVDIFSMCPLQPFVNTEAAAAAHLAFAASAQLVPPYVYCTQPR